jgi:uncharacterized protein YhhL (DUF1145 family)
MYWARKVSGHVYVCYGIDFAFLRFFYWILELFRQCGIFLFLLYFKILFYFLTGRPCCIHIMFVAVRSSTIILYHGPQLLVTFSWLMKWDTIPLRIWWEKLNVFIFIYRNQQTWYRIIVEDLTATNIRTSSITKANEIGRKKANMIVKNKC